MEKYLKINDFFGEQPKQRAINKKLIDCQGVSIASCIDETVAGFIVHAINSHDELAKKLQNAESTLDEVERVLSEAQKNGNYDFDDLLEEVIYAIKRIGEDD